MKVFFWPASVRDGCFAYRIEMQRNALLRLGHEVQMAQTISEWMRSVADVVVGQRVCMGNPTYIWQVMAAEGRQRHRRRMVYEVDDDLLNVTADNPLGGMFADPEIRDSMISNIKVADLVTVTTEPLAATLRRYNDNVAVLPNCLGPVAYETRPNPSRGLEVVAPVVGWQGSDTHRRDFASIVRPLSNAMTLHAGARMRFLGTAYPDHLPPARVEVTGWTESLAEHYKRVARLHVGLAPLLGTPFNASKSGLKAMEYAVCGVPAVCSDVPAYRGVVEHGVTGFLARTDDDWSKYIRLLLHEPQAREQMGAAAQRKAREWHIDRHIDDWVTAYAALAD